MTRTRTSRWWDRQPRRCLRGFMPRESPWGDLAAGAQDPRRRADVRAGSLAHRQAAGAGGGPHGGLWCTLAALGIRHRGRQAERARAARRWHWPPQCAELPFVISGRGVLRTRKLPICLGVQENAGGPGGIRPAVVHALKYQGTRRTRQRPVGDDMGGSGSCRQVVRGGSSLDNVPSHRFTQKPSWRNNVTRWRPPHDACDSGAAEAAAGKTGRGQDGCVA
jgi:hypothetical protein